MLERMGHRPHALSSLPARVAPGAAAGFRHDDAPDPYPNNKRQQP